jgi:hypothetical protein
MQIYKDRQATLLREQNLVVSALINAVTDFDRVYSQNDFGDSSDEATLHQVRVAFENVSHVQHKYDYLILDKAQKKMISSEYFSYDYSSIILELEFLNQVISQTDNGVENSNLFDSSAYYFVDYLKIESLDVFLICYYQALGLKTFGMFSYLAMILLSSVLTVLLILHMNKINNFKEKLKQKEGSFTHATELDNHTKWEFDLKSNAFYIDSSLIECLGYKDILVQSLDDYYQFVVEEDLESFKYEFNELMFNKKKRAYMYYRLKSAISGQVIVYTEAVVNSVDQEGFPLEITGVNVYLNNFHLKWLGE